MRILYHHRTQGRGVEGVHIREAIRGFRALGHEVDVVSPPGISITGLTGGGCSGELGGVWKRPSEKLPEIGFEILELLYNMRARQVIKRKLASNHFDLIFERYAIFNWSGALSARDKGLPIIMEVNHTSYTPLARKRSRVLVALAHRIDRWLFQNVNGFVAVSTWLKKHLMGLGVKEDKTIVLTNAADPNVFSPGISGENVRERLGLKGNTIIGYVGGFYEWHGLDLLMNAFRELSMACKDVKLLLIGDGPKREQLVKHALDLGLNERVCFSGGVPHNLLPEYIASFDIAVLPDSNDYCSPMKVFEYMATGKPVVAPDLGNLRESFTDGEQGILFKTKNIKALYEALMGLIGNRELRNQMGKKGRRHIIDKHNWQRNCSEIIRFYKRAIER